MAATWSGLQRQFSTQDLLDLQTWHNLAWFGYGTVSRYPRLAALRAKNRGFTEEEKQDVLALQLATVQDIVPLYRRLMEREQIELSDDPFFHPILPLVIDTDFTRRARPDLPLPSRFHAPEDAEAQLQRAVEFHTTTFGRSPVGLWPSEGSVCPELIPMLPKVGLRWLATDEGILARSLDAAQQPWQRHRDLYQPYRVGSEDQDVTMLFRDREISDAFGFVYHKTTPEMAAEDVLRRLRQIIHDTPQEQVTIAIVLDGENPWEHYHEGGEQFLSLLYKACSTGALDNDTVRTTTATISEALASRASHSAGQPPPFGLLDQPGLQDLDRPPGGQSGMGPGESYAIPSRRNFCHAPLGSRASRLGRTLCRRRQRLVLVVWGRL